MRKINLIVPAVIISLGLGSCSKEFLTRTPNDALTLDASITTESDLSNALNGAYSGLRNVNLFGRTLPVLGDVRADNEYVSSSNSGRYVLYNNYAGIVSNNADATGIFTAAYQVITRTNQIISNSTLASSANVDNYKGQAYALRGLLYFELIRNFAKPYSTTDPLGVPIVTEFYGAKSNPTTTFPRDSVAKVYRQIISDLEQAYTLMPADRDPDNSGFMSKYAARGLEAKVYLYMKDYENAKTAALDVVNNGGYSLAPAADLVAYWDDPTLSSDKTEVMFEVASDIADNLGTDQLGYIFNQAGGYGDILATKDLYNSYSATDVRKNLIEQGTRAGSPALVINKYPNPNNGTDKDDFPVIRYADVLLVLAEANYNLQDEGNALTYLNMVAKQRDPSFAGYTSTGSQVLENILTERRKELAFEGDRFYDLWRLGRTFTKVIEESPYTSKSIDPTNPFEVLPIPQSELDLNHSIVQNPGY